VVDEVWYGYHLRQLKLALPVGFFSSIPALIAVIPKFFSVCTNLDNLLTCFTAKVRKKWIRSSLGLFLVYLEFVEIPIITV
jgi:hypothetical protein